ncbi:hypothetical protein K458DRAFT_387665 [Lentithecium fluviatile CBS 122367]|uniref:Uncharacterized protein n=1 Tax=Lentithecium fluviatile CBS 122367 TaxID=1168545 RepID=A0A6G1J5A8_9PLEO|nr:hypothetical protein K458DRAFT_387665 [Lentithecium fluviatile CBS 122367]
MPGIQSGSLPSCFRSFGNHNTTKFFIRDDLGHFNVHTSILESRTSTLLTNTKLQSLTDIHHNKVAWECYFSYIYADIESLSDELLQKLGIGDLCRLHHLAHTIEDTQAKNATLKTILRPVQSDYAQAFRTRYLTSLRTLDIILLHLDEDWIKLRRVYVPKAFIIDLAVELLRQCGGSSLGKIDVVRYMEAEATSGEESKKREKNRRQKGEP